MWRTNGFCCVIVCFLSYPVVIKVLNKSFVVLLQNLDSDEGINVAQLKSLLKRFLSLKILDMFKKWMLQTVVDKSS
jgi:hypothetical protein